MKPATKTTTPAQPTVPCSSPPGAAEDTSGASLWAIVLAAGEGTRLAALTAAVHGRPVPKQFAAIHGSRTFLQRTMDRIAPIVPPSRTVVVVADGHADLATVQLAEFQGATIVRQPANRGTGAGVLLPLAHVLARDPDARVVVFPSDHHVARESAFAAAVKRAVRAADTARSGVALVGAAAESAATDLGWIACAGPACDAGARAVERFVEKPGAEVAEALLVRRALWNTLIIAARGCALWLLASRHVEPVASGLDRYRARIGAPAAAEELRRIYATLPSSDLSRDILEKAGGLRAVAMVDAGWSDCGTPERLLRAVGTPGGAARSAA